LAYWAAGICLDEDAGVFTNECKNGNNLAARYHVAGGNGVAIFYAIADAQKLYKSVRQDNPLVGDMIFWDNTWDRNGNCAADDKKTHMGIVKSVNIDGKGTIDFMHASSSKGVGKGAMNRTNNISSGAYNTQFRLAWTKCIKCSTCSASSQCGEGSKLNPCTDESAWNSPGQRANQLFTGYGTVRNVK
jgi:hypothetical protein